MNSLKRSDKIDKVRSWLNGIMRAGSRGMIQVDQDTGWQNDEYKYCVYIHTVLHRYHISAVDRLGKHGYLGCVVTARYPRPGEDWRRGNDLADGHLTRKTWERIKTDILGYELVRSEPCHSVVAIVYAVLKQLPIEMLPELLISEDPYVRAAASKRAELGVK